MSPMSPWDVVIRFISIFFWLNLNKLFSIDYNSSEELIFFHIVTPSERNVFCLKREAVQKHGIFIGWSFLIHVLERESNLQRKSTKSVVILSEWAFNDCTLNVHSKSEVKPDYVEWSRKLRHVSFIVFNRSYWFNLILSYHI